ncbi:MAG: hypothetical protein ACTSVZ_14415 [Promethearchaeota archaeon]
MTENTQENTSFALLQKTQIKFALICLLLSGFLGAFHREFGRAFSEGLSSEVIYFASRPLSLSHGHVFNIGFLIPLGFALITYFMKDKLDETTMKKLKKRFTLYMITGMGVFLLLFYKGIHFIIYSNATLGLTFTEVDAMLYGGSIALRSMLNASFHTGFWIAILLYSLPIFKSLKK